MCVRLFVGSMGCRLSFRNSRLHIGFSHCDTMTSVFVFGLFGCFFG